MKQRLDRFDSQACQSGITAPFEFAKRVYHHWDDRGLHQMACKVSSVEAIGDLVLQLSVHQLRLLRSAAILCAEGESTAAKSLASGQLEAAFGVAYVLSPQWEHRWTNKKTGAIEKWKPSSLERVKLLEAAWRVKHCGGPTDLRNLKGTFGAKWASDLIANPNLFLGSKWIEMAKKLGPDAVQVIGSGGDESQPHDCQSHGGPWNSFSSINEHGDRIGQWQSPAAELVGSLLRSIEITLFHFRMIDRFQSLGGANHMLLDSFAGELRSMKSAWQ